MWFTFVLSGDEIPLYYSNTDLEDIFTPINAAVLCKLLIKSNYPSDKIDKLYAGFKHGFDIEYQGLTERRSSAHNLPLMVGSRTILWNKLMKEVKC